MYKKYIVVNKNNEAIGIDRDSGGYPYVAFSPASIFYFNSRMEAMDYLSKFKNSDSYGLKGGQVRECNITW